MRGQKTRKKSVVAKVKRLDWQQSSLGSWQHIARQLHSFGETKSWQWFAKKGRVTRDVKLTDWKTASAFCFPREGKKEEGGKGEPVWQEVLLLHRDQSCRG